MIYLLVKDEKVLTEYCDLEFARDKAHALAMEEPDCTVEIFYCNKYDIFIQSVIVKSVEVESKEV